MKQLEKIIYAGTIALGLSLGATQYATAQSELQKNYALEWRTRGLMIQSFQIIEAAERRESIIGKYTTGIPEHCWIHEDKLYIGVTINPLSSKKDQYVFEMKPKPEELHLIKGLLDIEIKDEDEDETYFRISGEYKGKTIKADAIQIGSYLHYYFECK